MIVLLPVLLQVAFQVVMQPLWHSDSALAQADVRRTDAPTNVPYPFRFFIAPEFGISAMQDSSATASQIDNAAVFHQDVRFRHGALITPIGVSFGARINDHLFIQFRVTQRNLGQPRGEFVGLRSESIAPRIPALNSNVIIPEFEAMLTQHSYNLTDYSLAVGFEFESIVTNTRPYLLVGVGSSSLTLSGRTFKAQQSSRSLSLEAGVMRRFARNFELLAGYRFHDGGSYRFTRSLNEEGTLAIVLPYKIQAHELTLQARFFFR